MEKEPKTGGDPESIGQCSECESVYTVQEENGKLRPIGTGGKCDCGNTEFVLIEE